MEPVSSPCLYRLLDDPEINNVEALQSVALRLALPLHIRDGGDTPLTREQEKVEEIHRTSSAPVDTVLRIMALSTALVRLSDAHKTEGRPSEAHRYAELAIHIIEALQLDAVWPPRPLTRRNLFQEVSSEPSSPTQRILQERQEQRERREREREQGHENQNKKVDVADKKDEDDTMVMYTVRLAASVLLQECDISSSLLSSLEVTPAELSQAASMIRTAENVARLAPTLDPPPSSKTQQNYHQTEQNRSRARGQPRRAPVLLHGLGTDTSMLTVFRHCGIPCAIVSKASSSSSSTPRMIGSSLLLRAYATIGGLWLAWGSADDAMKAVRAALAVEENWRLQYSRRGDGKTHTKSTKSKFVLSTSSLIPDDVGAAIAELAEMKQAVFEADHHQSLPDGDNNRSASSSSMKGSKNRKRMEKIQETLVNAAAEDSAVLDSKKTADKAKQTAAVDEVLSARRKRAAERKEAARGQGKKANDEDKSGGHPTPDEQPLPLPAASSVSDGGAPVTSTTINPSTFTDPENDLMEWRHTHMPRPRWYRRAAAAKIIAKQWGMEDTLLDADDSPPPPPPLSGTDTINSSSEAAGAATKGGGKGLGDDDDDGGDDGHHQRQQEEGPTVEDVFHGAWEDVADIDMSLGVLYTAAAQLRQSQSDGIETALFSHRALRCRLPALLPPAIRYQMQIDQMQQHQQRTCKGGERESANPLCGPTTKGSEAITALGEWLSLALSLCGYYIQQRDLSHSRHCLAVTATILKSVPLCSNFQTRRAPPPVPEGPGMSSGAGSEGADSTDECEREGKESNSEESTAAVAAVEQNGHGEHGEAGTEQAVVNESTETCNTELFFFLSSEYHAVMLKLAVATYEQAEATREAAFENSSPKTKQREIEKRKKQQKMKMVEEPKTLVKAFWNVLSVPEDQVNEGMATRLRMDAAGSDGDSSEASSAAASASSTPGLANGGGPGGIDWATDATRIPLMESHHVHELWNILEQSRFDDGSAPAPDGTTISTQQQQQKRRSAVARADEFSAVVENILPIGLSDPPQFFSYDEGLNGILGAHVAPALAAADLCSQTVNLDNNCEMWLKLGRTRAEVFGTVFRVKDDLAMGKKRMDTLRQLLDAPLHQQVFRNVLRQGELDFGNTAMRMASLLREKLGPDGCKDHCAKYYEEAARHFRAFGDGFRREIAQAQRELGNKQRAVLEGADLPSYIVGEMCLAEALLKQKKYTLVRDCYQGLKGFLATQPQDESWRQNPVVVDQLKVVDEMLTLLQERDQLAAAACSRK